MKAYRKYASDTFRKGLNINVQSERISNSIDAFIKSMNLTLNWETKVEVHTYDDDYTETEFVVKFTGKDEDAAVEMMESMFGKNTIEAISKSLAG